MSESVSSNMIVATCSSCGKTYRLPFERIGTKARCAVCRNIFVIQPADSDTSAAAPEPVAAAPVPVGAAPVPVGAAPVWKVVSEPTPAAALPQPHAPQPQLLQPRALSPQAPPPPAPAAMRGPPPLPKTEDYFLVLDGAQAGPFNTRALLQRLAAGQFTRGTLVWRDGMPNWAASGSIPELAALFADVPLAPPPLPPYALVAAPPAGPTIPPPAAPQPAATAPRAAAKRPVRIPPSHGEPVDATKVGACPVCLSSAADAKVQCPDCHARHHLECWDYNGGCAKYGCPSAPETAKIDELEVPLAYWGNTEKECPSCHKTIQAAALRCRHCGMIFETAKPQSSGEFAAQRTLKGDLPGLRKKAMVLLIFCIVPFTTTLATLIGGFWYAANKKRLANLPAQQAALARIGLIIGGVQTSLLVVIAVLYHFFGT